ncbi:MAG: hypothetical protein DHS20C02_08170 [Micavibrio sp.]|nr:MAG: hypothetical protein DHS20C02_08170 [Micavibrio sp.]
MAEEDEKAQDVEKQDAEGVAQESPPANAADKKAAASGVTPFGSSIDIHYGNPLPQYNNGPVKAYVARGKGNMYKNLFALVCEKHLTPRLKAASIYESIINPGLVKLVKRGVVYWPPTKEQRYVLVYEDMLGTPLLEEENKGGLGWKQEAVMEIILPPITDVLRDFKNKDFFHGNIRPSNMFGAGGSKVEKIVLGDCLSAPPSYAQKTLYETIERGMADPIGRGKGEVTDDMYSLGVSLAVVMRSNDPLAGMSERDIVRQKMELGSYVAITGKDRFTGSILELLRGLLHDEPAQRWTVDEMMVWLGGTRLSPKQTTKRKKAPRPIVLGDKKYLQLPFLAMDLENDMAETQRLVDDGVLEQWLARSLEDSNAVEKLQRAVQFLQDAGCGTGYAERLVGNVSMVLDPSAPVRFKGLNIFGDGVGATLAEQIVLKNDIKPFVDMISSGIVLSWAHEQDNPFLDVATLVSRFDGCRSSVRQNKVGYGIERCLYTLNPECQCLSEKLAGYYVMSPEDMVYAFEDLCDQGKAPALFIDRHSSAFLSIKDRKVIDSYLYDLNASEDYKKILGNLKTIGTIQKRSAMPPMPALAKTLEAMLPVVYQRYHDGNIREKLEKNIKRFAESGDIAKMAALLDSPEVVEKDNKAFRTAMHEYMTLTKEDQNLELRLADKKSFGKKTGQDVSAVISSILASIIILVVVLLSFSGRSIF